MILRLLLYFLLTSSLLAAPATVIRKGALTNYFTVVNNYYFNNGYNFDTNYFSVTGGSNVTFIGSSGGDSNWTNSAGVLQPISVTSEVVLSNEVYIAINGVEYLQYAPAVPDGTIPYNWDTSVLHTTGDLFEFRNLGRPFFWINTNGIIIASPGTHDPFNNSSIIWGAADAADGIETRSDVRIELNYWQDKTNNALYGSSFLIVNTNASKFGIYTLDNEFRESEVFLRASAYQPDNNRIEIEINNTEVVSLAPGYPDSLALPNFAFTSYLNRTSGNLWTLSNSNVLKSWIEYDGTTHVNGIASYRSNLAAPTAITFPASNVNWTNTTGANIELYIDNIGITGTAIKKNGTQIFGELITGYTMLLQPGEYFSETYTFGTPAARYSPF